LNFIENFRPKPNLKIDSSAKSLSAGATALSRKPTITRIVRLNSSGMGAAGVKTQTLKLSTPGSSAGNSSASGNTPKIIKVTPEQFAALKAGDGASRIHGRLPFFAGYTELPFLCTE
jgi:hypothetical protein